MNHIQPVWGDEFLDKISNCSMGLNLSRGKPIKYYSSDRIAQLIGNGLLTFINEKTFLSDFFSDKEIIFYKNINDLSEKLNKYKTDKRQRSSIAKAGKIKYHKYFNSDLVTDYIIWANQKAHTWPRPALYQNLILAYNHQHKTAQAAQVTAEAQQLFPGITLSKAATTSAAK